MFPARSTGPPVNEATVTSTWSPPLTGLVRVRCKEPASGPSHETAVTPRLRPADVAVKWVGATEEQTSGLEKVTATVVEPPAASSPVGLGGTVSTVTVRVTAGETAAALSTPRTAMVWVPSASCCGARQDQDAGPPTGAPS